MLERSVVDELARAGFSAIHQPLLALHSAEVIDLPGLVPTLLAVSKTSVASMDVASLLGNVSRWRPTRAHLFPDGRAVGGLAPLSDSTWVECAGGIMRVNTSLLTPHMVVSDMPGRALADIAEFRPFSPGDYRVIEARIDDGGDARGRSIPMLRIECIVPLAALTVLG